MQFATFGKAAQVSRVGQGSWYIERGARAQAIQAFRAGLDAGMNHIDTAEMYADGEAETLIGEAIEGRRSEVFLVSKVLPQHASAQAVILACENSLRRLGTDYLDAYLLHWRGSVPLEETFEAFERLCAAGKIRQWGVSNFDELDLQEAYDLVGPGRIACNQVLYHLRERAIEHAVIPWCQAHQVSVVAYSPFGHDSFPEPGSSQGAVLQQLASEHGCSTRQIALSFLLRQPDLFVIPKSGQVQHVLDNAAAAQVQLSAQDLDRLEQCFARGPKPAYLPTI